MSSLYVFISAIFFKGAYSGLDAGCGAPSSLNPISALPKVVLVPTASPEVVLLPATSSEDGFFLACPVDACDSFLFPPRLIVKTAAQFSASLR